MQWAIIKKYVTKFQLTAAGESECSFGAAQII